MQYTTRYESPLGEIILAAEEEGLTGLWFTGQKHFGSCLKDERMEVGAEGNRATKILRDAAHWLDIYFSGSEPDFFPPLKFIGTDFQKRVWEALCEIPYGETVTYGELARQTGCKSARAVGGAVGRNPISIIVPCHRVIGADGSLTGYAGGISIKTGLLRLEAHKFFKA